MKRKVLRWIIEHSMLFAKPCPRLHVHLLAHWLMRLNQEKDRPLAMGFMLARLNEYSGTTAVHVSDVGIFVMIEFYHKIAYALKTKVVPDLGLVSKERLEIFRFVAFNIKAAVRLGRSVRRLENKKALSFRNKWNLEKDKTFLRLILNNGAG